MKKKSYAIPVFGIWNPHGGWRNPVTGLLCRGRMDASSCLVGAGKFSNWKLHFVCVK